VKSEAPIVRLIADENDKPRIGAFARRERLAHHACAKPFASVFGFDDDRTEQRGTGRSADRDLRHAQGRNELVRALGNKA